MGLKYDLSAIDSAINSKLRNLIAASLVANMIKFAVMSIDLEKTFDRVSHEYLWRYLEAFIRIIRRLYCDSSSKIQVNGSLTNSISIRNSVRQGCPLSMICSSYTLY
jgi:retron-type reverse transcriptase